MQIINPWKAWTLSFDHKQVIEGCHPAIIGVTMAVLLGPAAYLYFQTSTGLWALLPAVMICMAGVASVITWRSTPTQKTRIGVAQLIDVFLYSGAMQIYIAQFSDPGAWAILLIYAAMLLWWALFYSLSIFGAMAISGPLLFQIGHSSYPVLMFSCVAVGFNLILSALAIRLYVHKRREELSKDLLLEAENRALEVRSQFARHEIRSITTTLWEFYDRYIIPEIENTDDPELKLAMEVIKDQASHLDEVLKPPRKQIDKGCLLSDLKNVLIAPTHCTLHISSLPEIMVLGIKEDIRQILRNLIANAAEAGATKIDIETDVQDGDSALIRVSDNGPGISREIEDRLFAPYATWGKSGGTGLGLHGSRQKARAIGGELELVSSSRLGAAFCLCLPLSPSPGSLD